MSAAPEGPRKPSYARHWLVIALVAAAALLPRLLRGPAPAPPQGGRSGADWYMALRLPLLTEEGPRERLERRRLGEWLDELGRAGFRPMLLSEVRARLAKGERLAGKPVVLVIEPGYRRTYEAVAPLLASRKSPSLWLIDRAAVDAGDERFVSPHAVRRLSRSALCDTAFFRGSSGTFTLDGTPLSWTPGSGRVALNRGAKAQALQRLNVNFAWTGRQLVERLQAEVPVRGRTALAGARLFGMTWGVSQEASAPAEPFDVQAEPGSTEGAVSWTGTEGLRDLRLDLAAASVVGELWVYMGYDGASPGSGLRVGFTPASIVVDDWRSGSRRRVGSVPRAPAQGRRLSASLQLMGTRLSVSADGEPPCEFGLGPGPWPRSGRLLLLVTDHVRGVAMARSVTALLTAP